MQPNEDTNQPQQPVEPEASVTPPSAPAPEASSQPEPVAVTPTQPVEQQPLNPAGAPLPPSSPKKSNKMLFIILGAVGGGLILLAIIGWIVYTMLFAVSKADYAEAAKVMNNVQSKAAMAYSDVSQLSYVSTSGTQTKVKNDVASARASIDALKAENNKLKDVRALRDSDVKKAYDTYMAQFAKFGTYSSGILDSMEKLFPALKTCSDSSLQSTSNIAAYQAGLTACISELEDAQDLPDPDLKKLSGATLTAMKSIKTAIDELGSLSSSNYQRASEIRQDIYDAQDAYRDATTDARSNLEKRAKSAEIKDAYNDLAALLNEKQFK
jgi:hypothetical protein